MSNIKFVFFGTSHFSVYVLEALKEGGFLPVALVTFPDKPQGRKMLLTQNPVKLWAKENNLKVIEVTKFSAKGGSASDGKEVTVLQDLQNLNAEVFVVASFGKILPENVIYMPKFKTLNVHPSLLPKLRGPSPIQTAILTEDKTGVSIMRLDEKMDEGPILIQKELSIEKFPIGYIELEKILGKIGGELLAEVLPKWLSGDIGEIPQNRAQATYCKKIEKSDADISNDPVKIALRKILAFEVWPRARMNNLIVTRAHIENDKLVLDEVIPPGKTEMPYTDYLRGNK